MTGRGNKNRVLLGHIAGAQGIRGDVVIKTYTGDPADIGAYGPLQSVDGTRSYTVKVVRVSPKGVIARVAGIVDRNGAEALRGTALYADRARLGEPKPGEYFHADLIGLAAHSKGGDHVGTVKSVHNFGAGDLLEIEFVSSGKSEYIPFTDACVPEVDIKAGRLVVQIPLDDGSRAEDEPPESA